MNEDDAPDIDVYHCPNCEKTDGKSTCKWQPSGGVTEWHVLSSWYGYFTLQIYIQLFAVLFSCVLHFLSSSSSALQLKRKRTGANMTRGKAQISRLCRMAVRFSSRSFAVGHFQGKDILDTFDLFPHLMELYNSSPQTVVFTWNSQVSRRILGLNKIKIQ